ncbi:unnamed protein product [Scytosiphon promiscuus]
MKASLMLAAGLCGVTATQAFVFNPAAASRSASRWSHARRAPAAALAASGAEGEHKPQRVYIDLDAPGTPASKAAEIFREGNYPAVAVDTDPAEYDFGEWGPADWTKDDESRYLWHGDRFPERRETAKQIPLDTRAWEVQNDRVAVWDDVPNPVKELTGNEWYLNFAPSEMEIEAAEAGFDWTDDWFERNGMPRKDLEEAEAATAATA